ncbi:MAG: GAF and ANTAR domain-containing protein [Candidatus Omnitrophica bacterium]|nr:GAF and ANTAR domain-containing protein [Candidatus Omnitrophota bacterium]MDD5236124.1 GAF and ANTAR domain-containing protein [Candidatus Omnitrophota bacterium]MDD5611211.1 GAF and ANTAR domain-containing protein [Candidatus Omnitrophota bacterium]
MPKASEYQHIEALSKISKAITSELYLEDILKLIVSVTAQSLGSKVCSLLLLDEKKKELVIRATQSISEAYNKKPPLKLGEGIAGKVALDKEPIQIYDVRKEKEYKYKDIAKNEGLASLLCVPMLVKNRVIGVINLYTSKPHKFSRNEINTLTAIATQAAMVIENTELIVKTKVIQEELETRKLVERAKGVIMRDNNISEDEAYRQIQKYSMDSRKSMREIAEAIILTKDLKKT